MLKCCKLNVNLYSSLSKSIKNKKYNIKINDLKNPQEYVKMVSLIIKSCEKYSKNEKKKENTPSITFRSLEYFNKKLKLLLPNLLKFKMEYNKLNQNLVKNEEIWNNMIVSEPDISVLVDEEKKNIQNLFKKICKDSKTQLLECISDIHDHKHECIIQIKPGVGGKEANLFCQDLRNLYVNFGEKCMKWLVNVVDYDSTSSGTIIIRINGKNCYDLLMGETGIHRVQRVPLTESFGRIHTSTASVNVLHNYNYDLNSIVLKNSEIKYEFFRSSGSGGQNVNVTDSAVRLTHIPTGIIANCQETPSQQRNLSIAREILMERIQLREILNVKRDENLAKNKILTSDRSDKIRTYNYPNDRITDHRIYTTVYNIEKYYTGKSVWKMKKLNPF
ncbi:hypothetical protein A3Q56_07900 [Intoshia linei]|uniref:Prokaryotic-type class I peptide chain release factors domain-containing protein n=1 Tax=Intoshia linei TaxID=1819745 RepID=A0A177AQW1_9BILA|nr:hypothetical protein A3Q56_07900 [Intoshia linei]